MQQNLLIMSAYGTDCGRIVKRIDKIRLQHNKKIRSDKKSDRKENKYFFTELCGPRRTHACNIRCSSRR